MEITVEKIIKFIGEKNKIVGQGGCSFNDTKIIDFLLENYNEFFTQAEMVKSNSDKKWVAPSVSKSVKRLLALNLLEQKVVNTTVKYKINLDWEYGDTYKEENL